MLVTKKEISRARKNVKKFLDPTPVVYSRHYSKIFGADIFLKLETSQPTHSFKIRGVLNALLSMPRRKRKQGVIAASAGSHGLGLAYAASLLNIPCTIYLPENTREFKLRKIKEHGGQVVLHGQTWDDANDFAIEEARKLGRAYIHPFDDRLVVAGQATIFVELLAQLKNIDIVVTSIGGGGLICGTISGVQHYSPNTKVFGVETIGCDSMSESIRQGKAIKLEQINSVAESIGVRGIQPHFYDTVVNNATDVVSVSDAEAVYSLFELLEEEKIFVEPSASCTLAALSKGKIKIPANARVALVLCGANVSINKAIEWREKMLDKS